MAYTYRYIHTYRRIHAYKEQENWQRVTGRDLSGENHGEREGFSLQLTSRGGAHSLPGRDAPAAGA